MSKVTQLRTYQYAIALGAEYVGIDGRGHPRFRNPKTSRFVSVAFTESDWRTEHNDMARLRRLMGVKQEESAAGKRRKSHKATDSSGFDMAQAKRESATHAHYEAERMDELDRLRSEVESLDPQRDRARCLAICARMVSLGAFSEPVPERSKP